jgi:Zn-finger nucleic acid-binding protein
MAIASDLVCPKCGGRMRTYERTHIQVEQCEQCRGIFLDHGELERLIEAEGGGWSGIVAPPSEEPKLATEAPRAREDRVRRKVLGDLFDE